MTGDIEDSGIGLSYQPARLHSLAGRYANPMAESAVFPSHGLRIWLLKAVINYWRCRSVFFFAAKANQVRALISISTNCSRWVFMAIGKSKIACFRCLISADLLWEARTDGCINIFQLNLAKYSSSKKWRQLAKKIFVFISGGFRLKIQSQLRPFSGLNL